MITLEPKFNGEYVTVVVAATSINPQRATSAGWRRVVPHVWTKDFIASLRTMPSVEAVNAVVPLAAAFEHNWGMVWENVEVIGDGVNFAVPLQCIEQLTSLFRQPEQEAWVEVPVYSAERQIIIQKVLVREDKDDNDSDVVGELLWYTDPFGWVHATVFHPSENAVLEADFKPWSPDIRVRATTNEEGKHRSFGQRHVEIVSKVLSAYYNDQEVWDALAPVKDLVDPMEVRWETAMAETVGTGTYPSMTHVGEMTIAEWKAWVRQHPALTQYDEQEFEVFMFTIMRQWKAANKHAYATKPVIFTLDFDKGEPDDEHARR